MPGWSSLQDRSASATQPHCPELSINYRLFANLQLDRTSRWLGIGLAAVLFALRPTVTYIHRKPPLISSQTKRGAIDLHMFRSYAPARQNFATILGNYQLF